MKKLFLFVAFLLFIISTTAWLAWNNKKTILTHFLSKQLHTTVTINTFDVTSDGAMITKINIANRSPAKQPTAFLAEQFYLTTSIDDLLQTPLLIEEILIEDIFVGIEMFNKSGDDNNWSRMLGVEKREKKSRPYLIKTLILHNLTVELTKKDGTTRRYPTIRKMEFHNISDETGFPIEEIQKAIFKLMLQDLFKQLQLDQLIKQFVPNIPVLIK